MHGRHELLESILVTSALGEKEFLDIMPHHQVAGGLLSSSSSSLVAPGFGPASFTGARRLDVAGSGGCLRTNG